jgi:hypothetical protein
MSIHIVSWGGGVNSTALIIGLHRRNVPIDIILFADTGGEHPHTYEFIGVFNRWLTERGLPSVTQLEYFDRNKNRLTLEDECLRTKTLPSIAYGHKKCSHKHKIRVADKYCNNSAICKAVWARGGKVDKYIGYDAGERRRVEHAAPIDAADKKYTKHYPLMEWGWTREKCVEVIESEGLPKPGKSSCFFCPSMKKAEIQALYLNYPDLFKRAIALEQNAAPTLKTVKGLGRRWSWEQYVKDWLDTREHENAQTLLAGYVDAPGGCICGAPCGCYDG